MKNLKRLVLILSMVTLFAGCQGLTREFGGTTRIQLEEGEKFINVTWKENSIWVLVENENENMFIFKEYSNMGILNGRVIIKENK